MQSCDISKQYNLQQVWCTNHNTNVCSLPTQSHKTEMSNRTTRHTAVRRRWA